jgi:histidinol-phosphate/aromatic aminotransferase/cobyric acid decarboxylase-like protein
MSHYEKYKQLKLNSGTHSPSIATILKEIPDVKIEVDACFLSNPYATKLFFSHFTKDLIQTGKIFDLLEFYPSQNKIVADYISNVINVSKENIFVCNGAIEGIQAVLHSLIGGKLSIPIPTFSSYYEFCNENLKPLYFPTKKEDGYALNLAEYQNFIDENEVNNVLIINPNNPNGTYINRGEIISFIEKNKNLDSILIDESFIHFSYEDNDLDIKSVQDLVGSYDNLFVFKSMSKDFGIAGLRAGYVLMSPKKVSKLLKSGFLWNLNGLTEYFFKLYSDENFQSDYALVREKYIRETMQFINQFSKLPGIKVIESKSNFVLVEILGDQSSEDIMLQLLFEYGIYVRNCSDKIGLDGQYIRVAARSEQENKKIIHAFEKIFN